jgi:hypothetical protein
MISPNRLFVCMSFCVLLCSPISFHGQFLKEPGSLKYSRFKGQPKPSGVEVALLEDQARWDDEGREQNPTGMRLRFVKIDEPQTPGSGAERYRIFAEGAPENKVFSMGIRSNGYTVPDPQGIYVNAQGLLMTHKPTPEQEMLLKAPDDEYVVMPVTDLAVPVRYQLYSMDGQVRVLGTLVPHPVVSVDQGCRLEVRIAQPNARAVLIVADRFPARYKIPFVFESEGMTDSQVVSADANGHAVIADFPYVEGKTKGILKTTAEGPSCLPSVVLQWGPAAQAAAATP